MQIQFNQVSQFNHFNRRYVNGAYKSNTDSTLHSHRRMLEAQEESEKTEAVRVTISGEAMALARQAKAMERLELFVNANAEKTEEAGVTEQDYESEEPVQLTDEELYEELLKQVEIWGDKSYSLLHDYNHKETAEMAEKRAATVNEMQKLAEMQKSQISKLQRDAQKAAETAAMQQEEISKKNSELIMMIESFEDQNDEDDKAAESKDDTEKKETKATGSLMTGEFGAQAAKGEMSLLNTVNMMDASSTYRIEASDHSIKGVEAERINIYRANDAENFTMHEKMAKMEDFVCTLANNKDVEDSFKIRIKMEKDPEMKKKLKAKMEYFKKLPMKNVYKRYLKEDREFALQERITARDLRIAHLGDRHFTMAQQQKKELQSLFDEDDIMRTQGQSDITSRMEDVAKRLQDKLDERDHVDEDNEEIREKEEEKREELEKEQLEEDAKEDTSEKNSNGDEVESSQTADKNMIGYVNLNQ